MKKIILACIVGLVSITMLQAQQIKKSAIKVLFVGYDPAKPMPDMKNGRAVPGMMSEQGFTAEYPVRMPAFKNLLTKYFTSVTTMDVRDWKAEDSNNFDVTIFDFPTNATKEMTSEVGPNGNRVYKPAEYLPQNFSKPTIFISGTADQMGRSIGTKLDWLCLCLDADAHHLNTTHPIFKGPLEKVVPTMVEKPTPDGIFHYASGKNMPKQLPMWRVDKVGYLDSENARVGLVARGSRFSESPDTEMISSGVCQKDVGAVALGRHGNFFLWGFGASPAGMTDEGQKVFVNTVAYMAQFDGRTPIARKPNDRMATTDDVKNIVLGVGKDQYDDYVKTIETMNSQNVELKKKIEAKQAAGEKLSAIEEQSLPYLDFKQNINPYEDFLKQSMGKFYDKFGTDVEAYRTYMLTNMPYIYCDPTAFFSYEVDEDAKALAISNHDIKILDKCIALLSKNEQVDLAKRVLTRYTWENFETAKEWKNWLLKYKSKLFFSETNGYKFMIDTYTK